MGALKVGKTGRTELTVQPFHDFKAVCWLLSLSMDDYTTRGCPELGKFSSIQPDGRTQLTPGTLEETGHRPHWWLCIKLCPFR